MIARRRGQTVHELLEEAADRLESSRVSFGHGTANALDEAAWLLIHVLGHPRGTLNAHLEDRTPAAKANAFRALVERRIATRKPAAYLLHEAWLGPRRFYVDERVIVPRSFIAELLEFGDRPLSPRTSGDSGRSPNSILDLCTGSGCLAILLALAYPKAKIDAADISRDAREVAKRNVADYKLSSRVRLVQSDLFDALKGSLYDLIVSNPPYVKTASMRRLPEEHRQEPMLALASGADGLDHTRAILARARGHLNPGGMLVVEIGHNRKALEKAFPKLDFRWPRTSGGRGYVFTLRREDLQPPFLAAS